MVAGTDRGIFALTIRKMTASAAAEECRVEDSMMDLAAARSPATRDDELSIDEARLRQQAIGVKLRQMFDQMVNEPVPDEFLEILRRADERASSGDA
jgi:hypothetical protein